jgi:hypothetical protein
MKVSGDLIKAGIPSHAASLYFERQPNIFGFVFPHSRYFQTNHFFTDCGFVEYGF